MTPKAVFAASILCALALAGCTGGSDDDGGGTSTSTSGGAGAGGCVTVGGGGGCANTTVSGSASASSTGSSTNSTTNTTTNATMQETVRIANGSFEPDAVTVKVGGTVTWEHHDGTTTHTVTADDDSWDSSPNCSSPVLPINDCLVEGDTFSHTFTVAGDFGYHDKLDSSLKGMVHVVAS